MTFHQARWIGVDWGTSKLRAYAIDENGIPIAELEADSGMGRLKPDEFEATLIALIEPWLRENGTIPVYACGMAGARQGWKEASYRPVPCDLLETSGFTRVETSDPRIDVFILPGLSQTTPPDVMRGEETQIAGFLASEPRFSGTICLPGTHTKWVEVEEGTVTAFHTFMTGELFSLLSEKSILRHSVSETGDDPAAFLQAARDAVARPENVATDLFGLRAASLLAEYRPETARARLSGMIIGHEIGVAGAFWSSGPVVLIGSPQLTGHYARVLKAEGARIRIIEAKTATLSGLAIAARTIGTAVA